jgi:hypothetical protein
MGVLFVLLRLQNSPFRRLWVLGAQSLTASNASFFEE